MSITTDFPGAELPAEWAYESFNGDGSVAVAGSCAEISIPATSHDSIFSTSTTDKSVGIVCAIPDHGGDIDIAVQCDTDVTDVAGMAVNLLCRGANGPTSTDMIRLAWYKPDSTTSYTPRTYGYSRAGGSGAQIRNSNLSQFMSGVPAWLRISYAAATGTWTMRHSSDGVTWTTVDTAVRGFTALTFKIGVSNAASSPQARTVRINQVIDVIERGNDDLRDPVPDLASVPVVAFDGTESALPAGLVDASFGQGSLSWTGSALRLQIDAQSVVSSACVTHDPALRRDQWGILVSASVPAPTSNTYLTISGQYDIGGIDQYSRGGGYGLEVQTGIVRRPIRVDDPSDGNVIAGTGGSTGLDETPYCWLADETGIDFGTANTKVWFRLERAGRRYRVKEWADGDPEPTTWDLFDGQDEVEGRDLGPVIGYGRNGTTGSAVAVDIHSLDFYQLTAAVPGTADLDATLPALAASIFADVAVMADLSATLPGLAASLAADLTVTADLAGTLPALTAELAADVTVTGALDGILPVPAADLTGAVRITADLTAVLPALTGSLDGTVTDPGTPASGSLDATLPALTADLSGTVTVTGTLATDLPAMTGSVHAVVGDVTTGLLAAALPALTGTLTGAVTARGSLAATVPAMTAALLVALRVDASLDAQLPALTAALAATSAAGPAPRDLTLTATVGADRWAATTGQDRWAATTAPDRWAYTSREPT